MLELLITVIIAGVIFYLIYWLIGQIPLPEPFAVVARVSLALVAIVFLIGLLTGTASLHLGGLR